MSHELYEIDGDVMTAEQMRERNRGLVALTCEELRARIAELAAERDAAIDARLTAERDLSALRGLLSHYTTLSSGSLVDQAARLLQTMELQCDRVATERDATIQTLRTRIADLTGETAYLSRRVADLLGAGIYETVERALAEARREWAVVAGGAA